MGQDILGEQLSYYRARAPEYDEWWARRGNYALSADAERRWQDEIAVVEQALEEFAPHGDVLELASAPDGGPNAWRGMRPASLAWTPRPKS